MSDAEGYGHDEEIKVSETLRDCVWNHLPVIARDTKVPVSTIWHLGDDGKIKLTIDYSPDAGTFEIGAKETVNEEYPDTETVQSFIIYKGIEVNSTSGEIVGYGENSWVEDEEGHALASDTEILRALREPLDTDLLNDDLDDLEKNAHYTLTQDKLDFFLGLFRIA